MMTFPQTIRAVRESLNLTQAEFAHKLGLSSQTINNWETGRVDPWPRKKQHLLESLKRLSGADTVFLAVEGDSPSAPGNRKRPNVITEIIGDQPYIEVRKPPPHT